MVPDANMACYGLEYFCFEGDGMWESTDAALIDLAKKEKPQLIILDIMLPGMDGFSLCRTLAREGVLDGVQVEWSATLPNVRWRGLASGAAVAAVRSQGLVPVNIEVATAKRVMGPRRACSASNGRTTGSVSPRSPWVSC